MDDKTQKERLEQELRFLKESFETEVITKDEFEKGKNRVEKKLQDIEKLAKEQSTEKKEAKEEQKTEPIDKAEEQKKESKQKEAIEKEEAEITKADALQEKLEEEKGQLPKGIEQKGQTKELTEEPKIRIEEPKKEIKFFKYGIIFVVLVLVIFFSYSLFKDSKAAQEKSQIKTTSCFENDDCKMEGKEGFCLNAGTKDAKCEFKDWPKINVFVLNDRKNCFNCNTDRVLAILEDWFGALNVKEIDYNTEEGENMAEKFALELLPVYILGENITTKPKYEQFKRSFAKKDDNYVLSEDVAAPTFYFKRENMANNLDLFVIAEDKSSALAESNLKEFLDEFKEVKFEKHLSNDSLANELNIKTFPAFLVNNRVKFSGVHSAETIKNNFCKLNVLSVCEKSLSTSLV